MSKKIKFFLKKVWNYPFFYYGRGLFYIFSEKITGYRNQKKAFEKKLGYCLNLKNPRSLNEKIVWKKIYDRNPLLPITSDKYKAREYVSAVLGKKASEILVPVFWVGKNPEEIPFDSLPEEYVIKTNHDSGGNIIVTSESGISEKEIIKKMKELKSLPYGIFKHEWAYLPIKRKIFVEKLLREDDGDIAQDYKIHVFNGVCRFIHTTPKVGGVRSGKRSLFTPEWKQLEVAWKHPKGEFVPPPAKINEMISLAEKLSKPFDYVRVDFYNPGERIYFGELTHYHGSGMERFDPQDFDFEIGQYWHIIPRYWEKNGYASEYIRKKT